MWMSHPSLPGVVKTVADAAFYGGWDSLGWIPAVAPVGPPQPDAGWPVSEGEVVTLVGDAVTAQLPGLVDSAVGAAGLLTEASANATYGTRVPPVMYDTFAAVANGPLAGRIPTVGPVWRTTGAEPVTINAGRATSTGTGYAFAKFTRQPDAAWCDVAFSGLAADKTMTIAYCLTDDAAMLDNMIHLNFGPDGFSLASRRDGEATFPVLTSGRWRLSVLVDGITYAKIGLAVRGDTATVFGPNGEVFSVTNSRIAALAGTTVFWEPRVVGASICYLSTVTASDRLTTGPATGGAALSDLSNFTLDANGRAIGSVGTQAEVSIGIDPASGMPAIFVGASSISATLTSSAAISAVSLLTTQRIPPGSVLTLESGNALETVTSGAYSTGSASPFTTPITTGLTKAHPAGAFVGAVPPASARAMFTLNVSNGQFSLPNVPVLIAPGEKLYYGSQLDTFIQRVAAGVVGNVMLRPKGYTTATRPTAAAATAGACIYDSTLGIIVTSNGTAWVNGIGTVV